MEMAFIIEKTKDSIPFTDNGTSLREESSVCFLDSSSRKGLGHTTSYILS